MKDNIYSFEIIKEEPAREQEDILPKNTVANEEKIDEQLASPTTTIAAEEESQEQVEEILEKSTEANIEEEDKEILKEATTQLDAPEEVIEEAEHKEEPAKEQEVTSF